MQPREAPVVGCRLPKYLTISIRGNQTHIGVADTPEAGDDGLSFGLCWDGREVHVDLGCLTLTQLQPLASMRFAGLARALTTVLQASAATPMVERALEECQLAGRNPIGELSLQYPNLVEDMQAPRWLCWADAAGWVRPGADPKRPMTPYLWYSRNSQPGEPRWCVGLTGVDEKWLNSVPDSMPQARWWDTSGVESLIQMMLEWSPDDIASLRGLGNDERLRDYRATQEHWEQYRQQVSNVHSPESVEYTSAEFRVAQVSLGHFYLRRQSYEPYTVARAAVTCDDPVAGQKRTFGYLLTAVHVYSGRQASRFPAAQCDALLDTLPEAAVLRIGSRVYLVRSVEAFTAALPWLNLVASDTPVSQRVGGKWVPLQCR